MIPAHLPNGLLPPGIHTATVQELVSRFAYNEHRARLMDGFIRGLSDLKAAGCEQVWLDGSYVTEKIYPEDFDACWDVTGVSVKTLLTNSPALTEFDRKRAKQKALYGGEFFPAHMSADHKDPKKTFLEFFQQDSDTGLPKGIIRIDLKTFSP